MPASKPLISFVVTYHNEPKTLLLTCVESILALGLDTVEAEVVVVDDGSDTSAEGWLTAWVPTLRYIRQKASGLSVARNTGICAAQGAYLQFVDADDFLLPEAYSWVLPILRNESPDLVLFRLSTRRPTALQKTQACYTSGDSLLLHTNVRAAATCYAFRRSILGDLRFEPNLLHEDELFTPQLLLRAGCVISLDMVAYFYRQHEGSITNSVSPEMVMRRLGDIRFIICQLQNLDNPLLERRICQLTVDYLWQSARLQRSISALRSQLMWLRQEGLLPLALRPYSLRYLAVSWLANICSYRV